LSVEFTKKELKTLEEHFNSTQDLMQRNKDILTAKNIACYGF